MSQMQHTGAKQRGAIAVFCLLVVVAQCALSVAPVNAIWTASEDGGQRGTQHEPVAPQPQALVMPVPASTRVMRSIMTLDTIDDLAAALDDAWNAQDWPTVLSLIDQIIAIDPAYPDITDKEYYAHVNYGYELMTEGDCTGALEQFRAALDIYPTGEEAIAGLELLALYCGTEVPTSGAGTATLTSVATSYTQSPTPISMTPQPTVSATPSTTRTPLADATSHTVEPGDTLYSIANTYGTTVQAIMQANGMMSYFLRAGETIVIPATEEEAVGPIVHIVQPGETLNSIAEDYNTTVFAIMTLNNLSSYGLYAYRAIFVPSPMETGPILHIVQPGETLYTIATKYETTVSLLMLANEFAGYDIYVYQRVIIPPADWTGYPPIEVGTGPVSRWPYGSPGGVPAPAPAPAPRNYVVQPGDTLYSISNRFGVSVEAIKQANGILGSTIYAGRTLIIP